MVVTVPTPLIPLSNLFPGRQVHAKGEFLAVGGSFKIRGAIHLLDHLVRDGRTRQLVVPSMGNTALGAAIGAKAYGFTMTGVVPQSITQAKDEKLRALGVELVKIVGGGSELLAFAQKLAQERGGYFVHPHLDPCWTDGYQSIVTEVLQAVPNCRSLVIPVGGGGLLMGLAEGLRRESSQARLIGCEPFNFPKYARYDHARTATVADGLLLDVPHPVVQGRIAERGLPIHLVADTNIRLAMRDLYVQHGLIVEPSSAITIACVREHLGELDDPICVVLTGSNISSDDFDRLIAFQEF